MSDRRATRTPPEDLVQRVMDLYERGRTVDALHEAESFAPLSEWGGLQACIIASRIAANTGAARLSLKLAVRALRTHPEHTLARLEYGLQLVQWRGPLGFWFVGRHWEESAQAPEWRAELLAIKARTATDLRDFAAVEIMLAEAERLAPHRPWIRLQRAHLLEQLDRLEEALEVARAACALHPHPFYRPGVMMVAHLLRGLDRDDQAVELLREADRTIQNGPLAGQLYGILADQERWEEAEKALDRFSELTPLLDVQGKRWVQAQRARLACLLGRRGEAASLLEGLDDPFNQAFARRVAQPPEEPERLRLPVPFVRQHFKTCAPATLAALGRFWKTPAEHLALVEAFCYDGTPHWQQRDWAEKNGWVVREFRATWESAMALLTRGIPFAISTVEATSAHMQAVMGFDRTRGTLLMRDPSQPYSIEAPADAFLETYRPFGPHAMVFLPAGELNRLDGLDLPDHSLYDERHLLALALSKHDREKARSVLARLEAAWPEHSLTLHSRFDLAAYDANAAEEQRCADQLLKEFPKSGAWVLRRLACMREASTEERVEFLAKACASPSADPALFIELARNLSGDARNQALAWRWARRALRARPLDSGLIGVLADLKWLEGHFEESTELYRLAATVEGFREHLYQSWFQACRQIRQTDAALRELEERFRRFGQRSSQPAMTFAWALQEIEQPGRAREVLSEAARLRPEDGYLALRSAVLNARLGDTCSAERLLQSAKGKARENDWLRTGAEISELRFDPAGALRIGRELLALEPLALDAHVGVARALAQLEGHNEAVAHLRKACQDYPHHCGLRRLLIEWSRELGFEAVAETASEFLAISPGDAWTKRELAWALLQLNRPEAALEQASEAERIEPRNASSHAVLGHVAARLQQIPEARQHFRRAIELSVDHIGSIHGLLGLVSTDKERREELAFVEQELLRQVVRGDGLLAFLDFARPLMEPETLLKLLKQAQQERPDLWHSWSALVAQLDYMGRVEDALHYARRATEQFPHLPRTWLDLSGILGRTNNPEREIEAAQRAFELNPSWSRSAFVLARALERHRTLSEAKQVYERALHHRASDPQLQLRLGSVLWRLRQPKEALACAERALQSAPEFEDAWMSLRAWATDCGEPDRASELARKFTRERPGLVHCWLVLARTLNGAPASNERLAAVDRALELNPRCLEAWDLKAELLAMAEQFDSALEACAKGLSACSHDPHVLRGRRAWVLAQRGKTAEAVQEMRSVLAENASYGWGWHQLAAWLTQQEAFTEAERALEELLKLRPGDTWGHRQLAALRLKRDDREGAQKVFSEVLDVSPTDQYAAENLFNLQLESGNLTGAQKTLLRMQTHLPGARASACAVLLSLRQGDRSAALQLFSQLCRQPDPDPWPLQATVAALKKARLTRKTLSILRRNSRLKESNPQVPAAVVQFLVDARQCFKAVSFFGRIRPPEAKRRAAPVLVQGLGKWNQSLLLRWLLRGHRELLRRDDDAWGQVGYALARFKRMRAVVDWLADWRSRSSVEPWMLFNLCYALRELGRYSQAEETARWAVEKWGHRQTDGADMRLFIALEEALRGSTEAAVAGLQSAPIRSHVLYDQQLLSIAKALVEFQQLPPEKRAGQFKDIARRLGASLGGWRLLWCSRDVRRTFRRAGKVFVQLGAGWKARVWFGWRLNWQWLALPLCVPALMHPFGLVILVSVGMVHYFNSR